MKKGIFMLATALATSAGCWGEPHWGESRHSLSQVNIHATNDVQLKVFDATKLFGERNGFKVYATNDLPREGRLVSQVLLTRPDGVAVASSNFMDADTLRTDFYAEKPGEGWREVKEKWLAEMRIVVGTQGNVVDVILEKEPATK